MYYLNFHPLAVKMLGASWTGGITRMSLTTTEKECNRTNPPLAFSTANRDQLQAQKCHENQGSAWHQHAGGQCLSGTEHSEARAHAQPERVCVRKIYKCLTESSAALSSKLSLENKHFLASATVLGKGLDTSLPSWAAKELQSTRWIWPITALYPSVLTWNTWGTSGTRWTWGTWWAWQSNSWWTLWKTNTQICTQTLTATHPGNA